MHVHHVPCSTTVSPHYMAVPWKVLFWPDQANRHIEVSISFQGAVLWNSLPAMQDI